jgi:transposase
LVWQQACRLLSLATIYDGGGRSDAARIGDVGLQIIRDWVLQFNAAGLDSVVDRKAPGPEPRLNEDHRAALAAAIESGPIPAIHSVVRWRLVDLCQWLWEEFQVSIARQTLSRELRSLGYRKLTARPRHHAQAEGAIEHFKTYGPPRPQAVSAYDTCQSASTYPACGHSPGQDGDPRVPVLIKLAASERHF